MVVFVSFNYYGIKENGLGYFKHLAGPLWWLWLRSSSRSSSSRICIRPLTLVVRLMLNMAVDHLLVTVAASMFVLLLPIPIMVLGTLVVVVQIDGLLHPVVDLHRARDRARRARRRHTPRAPARGGAPTTGRKVLASLARNRLVTAATFLSSKAAESSELPSEGASKMSTHEEARSLGGHQPPSSPSSRPPRSRRTRGTVART